MGWLFPTPIEKLNKEKTRLHKHIAAVEELLPGWKEQLANERWWASGNPYATPERRESLKRKVEDAEASIPLATKRIREISDEIEKLKK